jgi:hypothetical protein
VVALELRSTASATRRILLKWRSDGHSCLINSLEQLATTPTFPEISRKPSFTFHHFNRLFSRKLWLHTMWRIETRLFWQIDVHVMQ